MKKLILVYGFEEERLSRLKRAAAPLRFTIKTVQQSDYGQKLGYLIGAEGYESSPSEQTEIIDEMLLMSGFTSADIDMLLMAMRKHGVGRVALKAVVTPTNIDWNSIELYHAVKEDHEAMTGRKNS